MVTYWDLIWKYKVISSWVSMDANARMKEIFWAWKQNNDICILAVEWGMLLNFLSEYVQCKINTQRNKHVASVNHSGNHIRPVVDSIGKCIWMKKWCIMRLLILRSNLLEEQNCREDGLEVDLNRRKNDGNMKWKDLKWGYIKHSFFTIHLFPESRWECDQLNILFYVCILKRHIPRQVLIITASYAASEY